MAFTIKQHDTRPIYVVTLRDNFGEPGEAAIDLTTATTVKFKMRESGDTGAPVINATMTIDAPATNGQVHYQWTAPDTATVGEYDAEFEITWSDGGIETVPNDAYLSIIVKDDLDSP